MTVARRPEGVQPRVGLRAGQAAQPGGVRREVRAPQATFRGSQAGRAVTPITPQMRQRSAQQLAAQVRQQNAGRVVSPTPGVTRDTVGNVVPRGTRRLDPARSPVADSFLRVADRIGQPGNGYTFTPHPGGDFHHGWHGDHDGWHDDHGWDGGFAPWFWFAFWYPFYFSDPFWYAWWYPGYYPAAYSYWGWTPAWVYPNRVYYDPYAYSYVSGDCGYVGCGYGYGSGTYNYGYGTAASTSPALDYAGLQQAVDDIRAAWINSDTAILANHLTDQVDVQVYFDGKYTYSTKTSDFYAMTADTMATTRTAALDLTDPVWISTSEVFVSGSHVFDDPMGERQTVYLSYRLRQLGAGWYIVAVGSSTQPIQSPYQDFRTG